MDCEKVRDRFSSLWEGELSPSEEKILKDHLSSCPMCQRELARFEKTMRWLHSAGEVEMPEGFLPELYKKLEQKKRAVSGERLGGRWFHLPMSFKLPIQAGAMVVVVFLALYLTKTIPMEGIHLRAPQQTSSSLSAPEKSEGVLASKEVKGERRDLGTLPKTPRPKDAEQTKAPVPGEAPFEEAPVPQIKDEVKKKEAPARSAEVLGYQTVDSREAARTSIPSPQPPKREKESAVSEKSGVASKPPQEIILRVSDRTKVIPLIHELVKQFGGEVVTAKGDVFLASVPTGSVREFEKELAEISSSFRTDRLVAKKQATESLSLEAGARRESDEKRKEPARLAADTESRTIVRILVMED